MEFQAIIKAGLSTIKIPFTDGSMNSMGTNPASYTTENAMIQQAIENCDQFKRGLIYIVNTISLDEKVHIERNDPVERNEPIDESRNESGIEDEKSESSTKEEGGDDTEEQTGKLIELEFDNNDDAKDYLETHFGYVRSKLRNREDIISVGKLNGVAISFS